MKVTNKFDLTTNKKNDGNDGIYSISYNISINDSPNERRVSTTSAKSGADFEKAISEAGWGKFNYLLLILALPASCSSTFDSSALSFVLPTASCDLKLDPYDRGLLNATIFAGMISSAFFWGYISDKFGRQRVLVFGYLGNMIFAVASCFALDFWTLATFKFLSGVMISGPFSIFMSYLSELFQEKHRDSVIMSVGLFQSIGGIFQPMIAWAIIPLKIHWSLWDGLLVINSWRLFLLISTLPSLISGIAILFCHESPKFLIAKGRRDEALRVFRSIYSINTGKPEHTYSVKKLKFEPHTVSTRKKSFGQSVMAIFYPPHLQKTLLIFIIQFGCLMTYNTMKLWLPQFFYFIKQAHQEDSQQSLTTCELLSGNRTVQATDCSNFTVDTTVYINVIYVSILTSVIFVICTTAVKQFGKRNVIVILFILQSAVISGLGWARPPMITVLAATFVALSNTCTISLLGFVVQIFPTSYRSMAVSLTMMFGRIGVCIGNSLLPFFLSLSCSGTFMGISTISMICGLLLLVLTTIMSSSSKGPTTSQAKTEK